MKICTNCGATYDDDVVFCRKCGEKLVDHLVCPKCGKPVNSNDSFCGACGNRLKDDVVPSDTSKYKDEYRERSARCSVRRVFQIIFASLFFAIALFVIIGFFGDVLSSTYEGKNVNISISYFFGDGAKQLAAVKSYYVDSFYEFILSFFILHNITYFGGLIASFIAIGFGIYNGVIAIIKKQTINKKYFLFVILMTLPYLMMTSFLSFNQIDFVATTSFGWGTKLLLVADIISVICYGGILLLESDMKPKTIASTILSWTSMFLMLFVALYGTTNQIGYHEVYSYSYGNIKEVNINLPLYYLVIYGLSSSGSYYTVDALVNLFVSFGFALITLILSYMVIIYLSSHRKSMKITSIVLCGLTFVFGLLAGKIAADSLKLIYGGPFTIGTGTIISMVLPLMSIPPVAISLGLKKTY